MKTKNINIHHIALTLFFSALAFSASAQKTDEELTPGATVEIGGVTYYAGPNLITNPSFDEELVGSTIPGWTNGAYQPLDTAEFQLNAEGGTDDGAYITAKQNMGASSRGSIATRWQIDSYAKYYFSYNVKGLTYDWQYAPVLTLTSILSTAGGQNEGKTEATMLIGKTDLNTGLYGYSNHGGDADEWIRTNIVFDSGKDMFLQFNARYLYTDQYLSFDDFQLLKLFPMTQECDSVMRKQYTDILQEAQTWADDSLQTDFPELYSSFCDVITEYSEVPENLEDIVDYLYYFQEEYDNYKDERRYNLLVREGMTDLKPHYDYCTLHDSIINAHENLAAIYDSAVDNYNYLDEWLMNGVFQIDENRPNYQLYQTTRIEILALEAIVRLRLTIDAVLDDARPSTIEESEFKFNQLSEGDYLEQELYDSIPSIDDLIARLKKLWKIRIHMGDDEGSFAERLSWYVDSLDEVEWLLVTGRMGTADMRALGSLQNLIHLDLSGVTSMKIDYPLSLHIDAMSDNCRPDVTLTNMYSSNYKSALTYDGGAVWSMKNFSMNYGRFCNTLANGSSLLNHGQMGAENVTLRYISSMGWDFISFPFNTTVQSITPYYANQSIAIREYSGENRAAGDNNNTWIDVADNATLEAGKGYIISSAQRYTNQGTYYDWSVWNIPAVHDSHLNDIFTTEDVTVALSEYKTDDTFAHNRSWNFIGNPYPCYLPLDSVEFDGPIIVWDYKKRTYKTYNLADGDTYQFHPGEAFFVQRPLQGGSSVIFHAGGRTHTQSLYYFNNVKDRQIKSSAQPRHIYDLTLSQDEISDITRIVVSDQATEDYEIGRDAAKFMSEDQNVPQIYSICGNVNYSRNELMPAEGRVALGFYIPKDGVYTIMANQAFTDIVIFDSMTGISTTLSKGESYVFTAAAGRHDNRIYVTFPDDATIIENIHSQQSTTNGQRSLYDLTGRCITAPIGGIYILGGKKYFVK